MALLLALPAAAEDFDAQVRRAVEELRPGVRAAPTIGMPRDPARYGWIDERTFLGPFGLRVDRSCMALESAPYPAAPAKFIATAREMHATLQRCASTRVLPATVGLIYSQAPKTRVVCDPKACEYDDKSVKAIACTDTEKGIIKIKKAETYGEASTLAHELMHFTKHVDNQSWEDHAHTVNRLRDEVYFWERHCFDHETLLKKMRDELGKRVAAAKLGYESRADLSRVHKTAFEVCAMPFRHNVRRGLWANEREIEVVCGQYASYLMMEINMRRAVRRLTAEAAECGGPACPSFEPRAALAAEKLLPPPGPPYSPEAFGAWSRDMCARYDSADVEENPSWLLRLCAQTQAERAADPATRARLLAAGLSGEEVSELSAYFTTLAAKGRALSGGPGRFRSALEKQGTTEAERAFREAAAECAGPLRTNLFCRELAPDAPAMVLLGRLFLFWQPKTLPAGR